MRKSILIVDDETEIRELVSVTLNVDDYQIYEAENGKAALEIARREVPDLIILDVMMPGEIDGYEVCRQIKTDPRTRDCVVVMLTARGKKVDRQKGVDAGADSYFTKPFSPLELLSKVDEVLADS